MNLVQDCVSICRLSCSFSFDLSNSRSFRVCIGMRSSSLPGFLGVGNQKLFFCCSDLFALRSSFKYVVTSGWPFGIILRIAISTGWIYLDCSGVTTENSVICVFFLIACGDSVCVGFSDCYYLVNFCRHWMGNQQTCCFWEFLK